MSRSILASALLGLTLLTGCEDPKPMSVARAPYPPMPEQRRFPVTLATISNSLDTDPTERDADAPNPGKIASLSKAPALNQLATSSKGTVELELAGPTFSGEEFDWSDYRGKIVIVLFWAAWHPICREDIENLEKVRHFYRYRPVEVVTVNIDSDVDAAKKFLEVAQPSFPVIMDGEQDFELLKKYPTRTIPMPVCVDKAGKIISMNFQDPRLIVLMDDALKVPYSGPVKASTAGKKSSKSSSSSTSSANLTTKRSEPKTAVKPSTKKPSKSGKLVKAETGVGKKGRGYGGGIVTEPIRAKFRTEQKLVFDVQIPKAMSLYQATNDKLPATHEEFMKVIIEDNSIELPELPAGEEYIYIPEEGELMVQRPE